MSDTAIADVQRRATEKLPHFVYPPAKPKLTSGTQTLLLVSDNLEKHELLIKADALSKMVAAMPRLRSAAAAMRPPGPAPTTAARRGFEGLVSMSGEDNFITWSAAAGASRRKASSHLLIHTRACALS